MEFRYWGLQSRVERFIHDGLRRVLLRAHRQAWAWQDEWVGLTMDDIRALERETQLILQRKLGHGNIEEEEDKFEEQVEEQWEEPRVDDSIISSAVHNKPHPLSYTNSIRFVY